MAKATLTDAIGAEGVEALAAWAIDTLCHGDVPATKNKYAYAAKVPWDAIEEGRKLMADAGLDWPDLHARQVARARERDRRFEEERRARHGAQ